MKKNESKRSNKKAKKAGTNRKSSKRNKTVKGKKSGRSKKHASNAGRLTESEKDNLRLLEQYSGISYKKVKPITIIKVRNENQFIIHLPQRSFIDKIQAINQHNFTVIDRFLNKVIPPKSAVVVFRIKIPGSHNFYISKVSPVEMHIDAESLRDWITLILSEYYNDMNDIIQEHYEEDYNKPWDVNRLTIRFTF